MQKLIQRGIGAVILFFAAGTANAMPLSMTFEVTANTCNSLGPASCGNFTPTTFYQTWTIANPYPGSFTIENKEDGSVMYEANFRNDATSTDSPFTNGMLNEFGLGNVSPYSFLDARHTIFYVNGQPVASDDGGASVFAGKNRFLTISQTEDSETSKEHRVMLYMGSRDLVPPFTSAEKFTPELVAKYFAYGPLIWTEDASYVYTHYDSDEPDNDIGGVLGPTVYERLSYNGTARLVSVEGVSPVPELPVSQMMVAGMLGLAYLVRRKGA